MILTLAHNPEAIVAAIFSAIALVLFGTPILYSLLSAFCFMLAGLGKKVSLWRKLLAPGICAVLCFLFVGFWLVLLFSCTGAHTHTPGWVSPTFLTSFVLFQLMPLPICRLVLSFGWGRSLLATLLIPLLASLCVGVSLVTVGNAMNPDTPSPAPEADVAP